MGYSDAEGGSSISGSDHELDTSAMFPEAGIGDFSDDDGDGKGSFEPALLKVVRMLLARMPVAELCQLVENWRLLSHASKKRAIPIGSGCSGSGMDWHVVKVISEVVLVSVCECTSDWHCACNCNKLRV